MTIFWSVIAALYLVLAIVTCVKGKHLLNDLATLAKQSQVLVWYVPGKGQIELASVLRTAFKGIVIAEVVGFIAAAAAAAIPAIFNG